jgi:hypothetical protein
MRRTCRAPRSATSSRRAALACARPRSRGARQHPLPALPAKAFPPRNRAPPHANPADQGGPHALDRPGQHDDRCGAQGKKAGAGGGGRWGAGRLEPRPPTRLQFRWRVRPRGSRRWLGAAELPRSRRLCLLDDGSIRRLLACAQPAATSTARAARPPRPSNTLPTPSKTLRPADERRERGRAAGV